MKNFRGLLFLVLALATSCSSQSSSESGVETTNVALPGTMDNDDASGAMLADTDWADTREIELELAWGGTITISVSIGKVFTLTNPDDEIDGGCALVNLPPAGTSYQRILVSVESTSTRDITHPRVFLGSRGADGEFHTLRVVDDMILYGGRTDYTQTCVPKNDTEFFGKSSEYVGLGQDFMSPGVTESFQQVLKVKPGAPKGWVWALLMTSQDNEGDPWGNIKSPVGMSPGALIFDLHDFNSDSLPELKSVNFGPNLAEQICSALKDLDVPSREGRDSENLKTLSRWSELNDSQLSSNVREVIDAYDKHPDDEFWPFSHVFARQRCEALGL